ncbi:MAG: substrate-binding domain-containing protein [Phycisphaerae bacterium]|nr:substrate-binding domain-containing protein [Phycisphaerae bacterium]
MKKTATIIILLVLAASVAFAAKGPSSADESGAAKNFAGQKIIVAGTGDSQELVRLIATAVENKTGGAVDVPGSIGSGGGIRAVASGKVDLARVAREPRGEEKDFGLTYLLFAKAPVIFAVNPSVTGIDNITTEQIIDIYSGRITDWSDLDAKAGKIYPLDRPSGDECEKVIEEEVPGFADIFAPAAKKIFSTPQLVNALTEHPGAIGITAMPSIIGTELRVLKIDGVEPSAANVLNGSYKYTVNFGIVYKDKPKGLAKEFVDFLFGQEGRKIITASGAAPVKQD